MASIDTVLNEDMTLEAQIDGHRVRFDVPVSMGGRNRAPLPPQVFVASLASCVGAVVADYCRRHDLDPTGLVVRADFAKADHPRRLQNLRLAIHLPNVDCDEACSAAVLERVAAHCPVAETIASLEGVDLHVESGSPPELEPDGG